MRLIYLVIIVILTGCADDYTEKPPGAISGFKEVTDNFILNHNFDYSIGQVVEDLWLTAKMCSDIHIDPLKKIQIDYVAYRFVVPDLFPNAAGAMWASAHYARIYEIDLINWGGSVTIHEFIHYLLWANGQASQSIGHISPLFKQCSPLTGKNA